MADNHIHIKNNFKTNIDCEVIVLMDNSKKMESICIFYVLPGCLCLWRYNKPTNIRNNAEFIKGYHTYEIKGVNPNSMEDHVDNKGEYTKCTWGDGKCKYCYAKNIASVILNLVPIQGIHFNEDISLFCLLCLLCFVHIFNTCRNSYFHKCIYNFIEPLQQYG